MNTLVKFVLYTLFGCCLWGCKIDSPMNDSEVRQIAEAAFLEWIKEKEFDLTFEITIECKPDYGPNIWICYLAAPSDYALGFHWTILVNELDGSTRVIRGL